MRVVMLLPLQPLLANLALARIVLVQESEHMFGVHVRFLDMAFCRRLLNLVVKYSLSLLAGQLESMLDDIVAKLVFQKLDERHISRAFRSGDGHS